MYIADFESEDEKIRIRPFTVDSTRSNPAGNLAYIKLTLYGEGDVNINISEIPVLLELLTQVKETYIDKLDLLK